MENENITLNEASIFYKRIDKDTYLIGKDKDSYGQFLIEDAIAPLLFSSINEINRKKMTTDSLSPDRRFIFYFYLMTLYFPKSIASIWSSQIHSYLTIESCCLRTSFSISFPIVLFSVIFTFLIMLQSYTYMDKVHKNDVSCYCAFFHNTIYQYT